MKLRDFTQSQVVAVIGTILFFAIVFVAGLALIAIPYWPWGNWHAALNIGLLLLVLGSYYGAIVALDRESEMTTQDRPFLRTVLCGVLASTAVVLVQSWPPHSFNAIGPIAGFLIGAPLGWLGWAWAKYIDF